MKKRNCITLYIIFVLKINPAIYIYIKLVVYVYPNVPFDDDPTSWWALVLTTIELAMAGKW